MGHGAGVGRVRRLGGRLLLAVLLGSTCLGTLVAVRDEARAQAPRQIGFVIPAGSLSGALAAFGRQAGLQVTYLPELAAGKSSAGLSGTMAADEALARLLAGSGLTYRFTNARTVAISDPAANPVGGAASGAIALDTIAVTGEAETAYGPTNGFIAEDAAAGTKSETPIIETPASVSVVDRKQLDTLNPQSIPDALRYTPGVVTGFFGNDTRSLDAQIYIRGFGDDASQLFWNGLGLTGDSYVNSPTVDPYLLERIEVLRGPASVLYGQTAPGGIVDMWSKLPTDNPLHEIIVGTGNYGRAYTAFDLGGPADADKTFLYRLTGVAYRTGTQIDDTTNERIALAPSFTWRPTDDTKLTVLATYQEDPDGVGFQSLPLEGTLLPSKTGPIPTSLNFGQPNYDTLDRMSASIGYMFEHRFNEVWQVRQNFRYLHADGHYRELQADGWADSSNVEMARWNWGTDGSMDAISVDNQAEAAFATGDWQHTALFGLDYRNQWTDLHHYWGRDGVPPLNVLNPFYGYYIAPPPSLLWTKGTLEQTGLYAQDQIAIGNWRFLIGGRQDWAQTTSTDVEALTDPKTSQNDDAFTWRAGAVYLFENGFAPYASYSTSFLPQGGTDWQGTMFEPTTAQQSEVGLKFQPDGLRSFAQIALFDLTQQNVLTADPVHTGFSVQTGEVNVRGVEVSALLALNDNFNLMASYTYNDLETTKANTDASGFDPTGTVPWYYPRQVASIWADYKFDQGPLGGLKLGGGIRYVGAAYNGPQELYEVPGYTLVDALVSYDFGVKYPALAGLELNVNVNNLFDETYLARCSEINCSWGIRRTILANLKYRW